MGSKFLVRLCFFFWPPLLSVFYLFFEQEKKRISLSTRFLLPKLRNDHGAARGCLVQSSLVETQLVHDRSTQMLGGDLTLVFDLFYYLGFFGSVVLMPSFLLLLLVFNFAARVRARCACL